jgi:hypothetical protein
MANLIPVSHDPFSTRPFSREFNVLTANMAVTVNKLTELVAKIDAVSAAAHRLDEILANEMRRVAEVVDAGATHFDDKLTGIRADIAASTKRLDDIGKGMATKLATEVKAAVKEIGAELVNHGAAALPVHIERSKDGRPMKIRKGETVFSVERQRDGTVIGLTPEGPGPESTPKTPRASKRFQN